MKRKALHSLASILAGKRFGVLFLLALGSLPACGAGFTRVQAISNSNSGGGSSSSTTVNAGAGWGTSTAGNALVVACAVFIGSVPTISDNKGDSYTLVTSVADSSSALGLYVLPSNPGGISSITCTTHGSATISMIVMELSGAAAANAIDQFSANDDRTSSNPWTSNSTPAQTTAGDYGVGVAFDTTALAVGPAVFTAGSGWTSVTTDGSGSLFLEEQNTVSGTSVVTATGTDTDNGPVFAIAATLKPAGGGVAAPSITSLSPTSGPVGTSVTITGTNFGSTQGTVTFNGTTAAPTSWSNTSIVVSVPSAATTGNVVVTAGGNASNGVNFTVIPNISSLSPASGPVGTSVTITGTGFGSTQGAVTFKGTAATVTSWSNTSIVVTAPSAATTGNVVVTAGGNASNGVNFTVTPFISSLSPNSGAVGVSVTITGTNFGSTQGAVTFNGATATITSWSNTSVVATVPGAATTGNVVVTAGGNASNGVNFTVIPTISSLSPVSGPVGTSVTITGTGFGSTQGTVSFNGTAATVTSWSNTSIVVAVPNGATTGNVVVTAGGNASNGINFTVTPGISSLSPASGAVGSPVTITGTNFSSTQGTVKFNGTAATATSWSDTSIAVTVPNGATTGNVVVTAGGNASNGVNFTVIPSPSISSVSPIWGDPGAQVIIQGTNLSAGQGGTVTFNGVPATTTGWSATTIVAAVPSGATTGPVVVTLFASPSNGTSFTVPPGPPSPPPAAGATPETIFVDQPGDPPVPLDMSVTPPVPAVATFCNNTSSTDTPPQCSLREAVIKSNSNAAPNTIMIGPGTFTLSIPSTGLEHLRNHLTVALTGHLDIINPVTIVGQGTSGPNATIIQAAQSPNTPACQAGQTQSGLIDQVFVIDASQENLSSFPVTISNLVISGGQANQLAFAKNSIPNCGGAFPSGGAFEWNAGTTGMGKLTLTNVVISGNTATDNSKDPNGGDGGGIALFNATRNLSAPAQVSITGSTIQNNAAFDQGGGIAVKGAVSLIMSNSTVSGNQVVYTQTLPAGIINTPVQEGGGLSFFVAGNAPTGFTSSPSQIDSSTISGNTAGSGGAGEGGGIFTQQTLTIDQGSFIQGNVAGAAGGGIATALAAASDTLTITSSTITGNTTSGNGGGIEVDANSNANLQLQFNRIVGNSSTAGASGLANLGTGAATATDNWWGCNLGPTAGPCDTVSTGVNASPFITLINTPSPNTVIIGNPATLTASFLQDSAKNQLPVTNLGPLLGLPVSWLNPVNGTVSPNPQITIQPNGTATAGFTPNGSPTASAQVSVDQVACQSASDPNCLSQATIPVQDFTISISPPSQNVNAGTAATVQYTVTVTAISGFNGTVQLTCNPPPGLTGGCSPTSITGSGTSTYTVTTAPATSSGAYSLPVVGTSGSLTRSASASLTVANYAISLSPSSDTINLGQQAAYTVTCSTTNGFSGPVQLSSSLTPASFNPNPVNCPGTSTLTLSPGSTGNVTETVTGTSGSFSASGSAGLNVQDFSLSVSPASATVNAGTAASVGYTVTVTPIAGFNGVVQLPPPTGLGGSCNPSSITGSGTSTCTVNTTASTPPGTYLLSFTGTSGSLVHSAGASLVVAGFTISLSPNSDTINLGQQAAYTVTCSTTSSFTGVQLTSSVTPASFSANPINCPGTSTLTLTPGSTGNLTETVTGQSGGFSTTGSAGLNVQDFSLSVTASATVNAGTAASASYTVTVAAIAGFNGVVQLPFAPPAGFTTGGCNPSSITGSGTSICSVNTTASTAPGTYPLSFPGNSGNLSHSAGASLVVAGFTISLSPSSDTINLGQQAAYTVTCATTSGFSGPVQLSSSITPANFSANPVSCPGTSILTMTPSSTGNVTENVTGTSGSFSASGSAGLNVQDFSLSVSPATQTVNVGVASTVQYTVTVTAIAGFNGVVQLPFSPPSGLSGICNPSSIIGSGTSICTVNTTTSTAPGTYALSFPGTSGNLSHLASAQLTVADFSISVTAPDGTSNVTLQPGQTAVYTVNCSSSTGFNGAVQLSTSIPGVSSVTFSNNPLNCPGQSALTVVTPTTMAAGVLHFNVTGLFGSAARSGAATLTLDIPVQAQGSFTIQGAEQISQDPSCSGQPVRSCFDVGKATINLNGQPFQTNYGANDDVGTIADRLAAAVRNGSSTVDYTNISINLSSTPPIATITLIARSAGSAGNSITLSTDGCPSTHNPPIGSYTCDVSGATLSGGKD